MTKLSTILFALLCFVGVTFAQDWSPEIVLWENPSSVDGGPVHSTISVDTMGNVHIVYQIEWRLPGIIVPLSGLMYNQFDDHGHVRVPAFLISDSLDEVAEHPRLRFFGNDSLWIVWDRGQYNVDSLGRYRRLAQLSLDMNGNRLGPLREWPEMTLNRHPVEEAITVTPDRRVVAVYPDSMGYYRCVVQCPDGSRVLNHVPIIDARIQAALGDAFVDRTDSLQVSWTQAWYAPQASASGYAKRVCITQPFDSSHISDRYPITPHVPGEEWGAYDFLRPRDESLLAFPVGGPGDSLRFCIKYLRVVRRADYSLVSQTDIGYCDYDQTTALESDSVIGSFNHNPGDLNLNHMFFSYPGLSRLDESIFYPHEVNTGASVQAYAVSRTGTRHVICVVESVAPNHLRVVYRYWPYNQNAVGRQAAQTNSNFKIWPNPVADKLTLEGPLSAIKSVAIYNILGQNVRPLDIRDFTGQRYTFSIPSSLPSGPYFLQVRTVQGMTAQKFTIGR